MLIATPTTSAPRRGGAPARSPQWPCQVVVLLLALAVGLVPAVALAQDERVTVRLDGRALFRVGPTAELDATARARRIEARLETLLENPQAILAPRVEPGEVEGERVLTVAGVPVVTITQADAEDNLTTPEVLAAQWAQVLDSALVAGRDRRLSPWGRFRTEVQSAVTAAFARLGESALTIVPRALAALLVLGLFWLLAAGARGLMHVVFLRLIQDRTIENLIRQFSYYAIWALGLFVALDALGFDPQTVITGLGLTGLALGFALRDIISNFVSGLLILALRIFEIGDQVVIGETEGNVERIELRATQIRTYDGRAVLVPNADVFTSRVINNTANPIRRVRITLPLDYSVDLERALPLLTAAAQGAEGVLEQPPAAAVIEGLETSALVVEVRFSSDSRRSDVVATTAAVQRACVLALKAEGMLIAASPQRLAPQSEGVESLQRSAPRRV